MCVLAPVWKPYMAETSKRKTWESSSTSSIEDGLSPDDKKIRCNASLTDSEANSEPDEVISLLNMVEAVMPKLNLVLEKLGRVEYKLEELRLMLRPWTPKLVVSR